MRFPVADTTSSARDRAIEEVAVAIATVDATNMTGSDFYSPPATAAVDALLARPEVLRALADHAAAPDQINPTTPADEAPRDLFEVARKAAWVVRLWSDWPQDRRDKVRALSGHLADAIEDLRAVLARRTEETQP